MILAMRAAVRRAVFVLSWALVSAGAPVAALADTVGIARTTLSVAGESPLAFSGCLAFDDTPFDVFGTTVNLGDAGFLTVAGDAESFGGTQPLGSLTAQVGPCTARLLAFANTASTICAVADPFCAGLPISVPGRLGGLAGTLPLPPAGLVYTFDGVIRHVGGDSFDGLFGLNAFLPKPTPCVAPPCDDLTVSFETRFFCPETGIEKTGRVDVTYASVTSAGTTTVLASCNGAGVLPEGFVAAVGSYRGGFFDVSTTAAVTGPITLCVAYEEPPVDDCLMRILHKEGDAFVGRTLSLEDPACSLAPATACPAFSDEPAPPCIDPDANVMCAQVDSLSLFGLAVNAEQADEPIGGRLISIKTKIADPAKNKLSFKSKEPGFALPRGANDPRLAGATLRVRDGGGQEIFFKLPAGPCAGEPCWRALGDSADPVGFSYRDRDLEHGPCRSVVMKQGRGIAARCKGAAIALTPPFTPPVEVMLHVGAGSVTYCAAFGGQILKNDLGTRSGTFKAKGAAAPGACPEAPMAAAASVRRASRVISCPGTCLCGASGECNGLCPPAETCDTFTDGTGTDFCACIPQELRSCGDVETPECDALCPSGQVCTAGDGVCVCVESANACGDEAGPPTCSGTCASEEPICATFLDVASADFCGCISDEFSPCGTAQAPACDGICPTGQVCIDQSFQCACLPTSRPCGDEQGPPSCSGACPSEAPVCAFIEGECTCTTPICGDGEVNRPGEDCDAVDDSACPGKCNPDCTCLWCDCYFNDDCPLGTLCDVDNSSCLLRQPKPLGVVGGGCNLPWDGVAGPCDGRCTPLGLGSSFAAEESTALVAGIHLWAEASVQAAESGGGLIDQGLAQLALTSLSDERRAAYLLRHVASVLVGVAGQDFFITHSGGADDEEEPLHEPSIDLSENPCERYVSDLSENPCTVEALRLGVEALVAEIESPGSGAAILDEIPGLCPGVLANAAYIGDDPLEFLKQRIAELAVYLRTPPTAE